MSSMTRMMDPADRRTFGSRAPPYARHPDYHRRLGLGPGPTLPTIPRRYEPYRPHVSRRLPQRLPSTDIPRVPPVPHSTPSPPDFRTGPKNYDPLRPEGLYQASKGARRDIKWMQKHSDKPAHSSSQHASQPDGPLPPYQPRPPSDHKTLPSLGHESQSRILPTPARQGFPSHPIHGGIHRLSNISPRERGEAVPFPKRQSGPGGSMFDMKDIKEQQNVIAAARAQYVREKQEQKKGEWERKVKRIQMQVFVHARPTSCPWGSCPALLNSWALLEKHLLHSHLHPQSRGMPAPGKPVQCNFKTCDQVFGTVGECYQHCLSTHMGTYGARCPFNCAFEGPSFDELMAHIGRRHRKATPDDFVPGLIHHFPPNLPPASALPKLPDPIPTTPAILASAPTSANRQVQPLDDPSPKVISLVSRKCFSQRKPLPEKYAKMKGASAAISALIENTQRERLSTRAIPTSNLRQSLSDKNDTTETPDPIRGSAQEGLYHSPEEHGRPLLDLIDIEAERRRAEKEAKATMKVLINSGEAKRDRPKVHRFWTRSHSGESDINDNKSVENVKNDTWYTTRRQSRILDNVKQRTLEVSDDSDSVTEDGVSDSASASSTYIPQRRSVDLLPPTAIRTRLAR